MTNTQRTGLVFFLAAIALAVFATPALAQGKGKKKFKLNTGDKALLFNMDSVFNSSPTTFDNIGIGARYALNQQLVIRGGLGYNQTTSKFEQGSTTNEEGVTGYSVEAGAEFYLFQTGPVGVYAGGILQYGNNSNDPPDGQAEVTTTNITVSGILGANYMLLESLSLGAEYRLGYNSLTTETSLSGTTSTQTDTRIGTGSVGFILGFWF